MDAIIPWLYIGKYRDTLNGALLSMHKIGAILELAEPVTYPTLFTLYLPVEDGEPLPQHLLRQGVDFILAAKRQEPRVLVACGAGISRSVAFAVAALKEAEGLSLLEALRLIHIHHSEALPHPALWGSLCEYYQEDVPLHEMLGALHNE